MSSEKGWTAMTTKKINCILMLIISVGTMSVPSLCDAAKDAGCMKVLIEESSISIPPTFAVDLRYADKSEGLIMFREFVDGEESGATIGISFERLDSTSKEVLRNTGYSSYERCGFTVFSRQNDRFGDSTIIILDESFIEFGELAPQDAEGLFDSLCER